MRFIIGLLITFSLQAQAEYRVFKLRLEKPTGDFKEVLSTLDAYQYTSYYPVDPDISIVSINSWLCLGDTSNFLNYCEEPEREPASIDEDTEVNLQ